VLLDQDSRPVLSNRYEDYGWPATIVFGPKGEEIVKRQGPQMKTAAAFCVHQQYLFSAYIQSRRDPHQGG